MAGGEPACARFSSTDLGHFTRPRANGSFFFFFAFCAFNLRETQRESAQLAASTYRPYENSIESEYQCYDIGVS